MTIIDEYLDYHKKYEKLYGNKIIVCMQIGSFHESYATNTRGPKLAEISDLLNIVLTRKDKKIARVDEKNPQLIGFPSVCLNKYVKILIDNGYTVVVIDQVTPPPNPERKVTGVYSPGTYFPEMMSQDANNIVCLFVEDELQNNGSSLMCIGMSVIDLSTGANTVHEAYSVNGDEKYALDEAVRFINNYNPKETIVYRKQKGAGVDVKGSKGMSKDALILYLELEAKICHYYTEINKHVFKLVYQNEFLGKIFQDCGMLTPIEYLDMEKLPYAIVSLLLLLGYAYEHNENIISNIYKPVIFQNNKHLLLGNNAVFQLNILENSMLEATSNTKFKSLFDVVNNTSTAMGRRYLKDMITSPLSSHTEIETAYGCVEELLGGELYLEVEESLKYIMDLERLSRKLMLSTLQPYEFANMLESYRCVSGVIKLVVAKTKLLRGRLPDKVVIKKIEAFIKECDERFNVEELKKNNLNEIVSSFYSVGVYEDVDELEQKIRGNEGFMEKICSVLSQYVEDVGKARFRFKGTKGAVEGGSDDKIYLKKNDIQGYYLSLTKLRAKSLQKNLAKVKQIKITETFSLDPNKLVFTELRKGNTKIFIDDLSLKSTDTVELKEKLTARVRECYLENLAAYQVGYKDMFRQVVNFISMLDYYKSNAKTAKLYNYVRPKVVGGLMNGFVKCEQLRHPIVERIRTDCEYVPHDFNIGRGVDSVECEADVGGDVKSAKSVKSLKSPNSVKSAKSVNKEKETGKEKEQEKEHTNTKEETSTLDGMLIYGLNSSGKTVCMKAVGLSVVMAQCGMFVPATRYEFAPYEGVYARITGNDNLFKGLSSFALEMTELRSILKRSGPKTLVIGDEICRGTEYISGNAIVAATIINLAASGSSFIFATHLHDIVKLEKVRELKNVRAFHLTVEYDKEKDMLIFDRKLKPGSGEEVYGITVAKYIIHDDKFMRLAQEIKNELLERPNCVVVDKTSRYNSSVYMQECTVCKKQVSGGGGGGGAEVFDTHHINFQKDCVDGFVKAKPHLRKDAEANLTVLCKECHHKVHNEEIDIVGYLDTSKGRKIKVDSGPKSETSTNTKPSSSPPPSNSNSSSKTSKLTPAPKPTVTPKPKTKINVVKS